LIKNKETEKTASQVKNAHGSRVPTMDLGCLQYADVGKEDILWENALVLRIISRHKLSMIATGKRKPQAKHLFIVTVP